eukprot:3870642-Pyramimonas_sp.AAC.1
MPASVCSSTLLMPASRCCHRLRWNSALADGRTPVDGTLPGTGAWQCCKAAAAAAPLYSSRRGCRIS